jgi:hypothetical protein
MKRKTDDKFKQSEADASSTPGGKGVDGVVRISEPETCIDGHGY